MKTFTRQPFRGNSGALYIERIFDNGKGGYHLQNVRIDKIKQAEESKQILHHW